MMPLSAGFLSFCWLNLPPYARARILKQEPGTLWLFGAGVSHHYNLNQFGVPVPLAGGFFGAFNELPTSQDLNTHVGPLVSFLEHYRGIDPRQIATWNENIEDFMTSIEAELEKLRSRKAKRKLTAKEFSRGFSFGTVFNYMNFIFANVLNETQNGASTSLYHQLLTLCGPNDAFITFNWDIDRALADSGGWSPNDAYGVKFAAAFDSSWRTRVQGGRQFETNWKLLKLHVSTNWLMPHVGIHFQTFKYQSIVPNSERVFITRRIFLESISGGQRSRRRGEEYSSDSRRASSRRSMNWTNRGFRLRRLLITPVRQKKYGMYASTIENNWKQAEDRFKAAKKVVIIGYSFPPTDVRPMKLLRSTLNARPGEIELEIVAPGVSDIVSRIGEKVLAKAKRLTAHDMKFDEYLAAQYRRLPDLMSQAAAADTEVRDWMLRLYAMNQVSHEQRVRLHGAANRD
jgi:hypothetical protein